MAKEDWISWVTDTKTITLRVSEVEWYEIVPHIRGHKLSVHLKSGMLLETTCDEEHKMKFLKFVDI